MDRMNEVTRGCEWSPGVFTSSSIYSDGPRDAFVTRGRDGVLRVAYDAPGAYGWFVFDDRHNGATAIEALRALLASERVQA